MKSKLKLAFDELEKELTIITQSELAQLMGGTGSGYDIDAVLGQIASDLIAMGFPLTESSGNYYFNSSGNGIMLEAVEVYAYSTGMNSSGDGHSGYSSGLGGGDGPLDMVIGYLQNMGFSFSYSNGSYSYHNNNNNNSSSNSNNDPWKRDSNGKVMATPTGAENFDYNAYGDNLVMEEYVLETKGGALIKAYKAIGVKDANGNIIRQPTADERSNCIGYALTGGEYTFINNPDSNGIDEGRITRNSFNQWSGYVECSKEEASMIVIYGGTTYTSDITHIGIINADGTYNAKGGGGDFYIRTGMSEAEFYKPYPPGSDGKQLDYTPTSPDQIVYYKRP